LTFLKPEKVLLGDRLTRSARCLTLQSKQPRIRTKATLAKKRLMILELENPTNAKNDNEDKGDDSSSS
jgi:hypothetical protein